MDCRRLFVALCLMVSTLCMGTFGEENVHVTTQVIGRVPGDFATDPVAINNRQQVALNSSGPAGIAAYRWSSRVGFELVVAGGTATDINDAGNVSGVIWTNQGCSGFLWDGTIRDSRYLSAVCAEQ